jgi:hypothetical protein
MQPRTAPRVLTFLLLALAACATAKGHEDDPEQVVAMVACIERVQTEAERGRKAITDAFEHLNVLAAGRFGKEPAATVFARFVQSIDVAEQQAKRFREVVEPMVASAQPVFAQWQADIKSISGERLRKRSEMRYSVAKERYDAITKTALPAQDQFDGYVKALRDHAAFLAHDLNPGAIADIQDEVKVVARTARELDRTMESCQAAARAYVAEASQPAVPAR